MFKSKLDENKHKTKSYTTPHNPSCINLLRLWHIIKFNANRISKVYIYAESTQKRISNTTLFVCVLLYMFVWWINQLPENCPAQKVSACGGLAISSVKPSKPTNISNRKTTTTHTIRSPRIDLNFRLRPETPVRWVGDDGDTKKIDHSRISSLSLALPV